MSKTGPSPPGPAGLSLPLGPVTDEAPATPVAASTPSPAARAPIPDPTRLFAVIGLGGTQYKVTTGDMINAEHLPAGVVGQELPGHCVTVLAVGSSGRTLLGRPTLDAGVVRLVVEEQALDRKIIVYKKKRRKRYQRLHGHRRKITRLRVVSIDGGLLEAA